MSGDIGPWGRYGSALEKLTSMHPCPLRYPTRISHSVSKAPIQSLQYNISYYNYIYIYNLVNNGENIHMEYTMLVEQ